MLKEYDMQTHITRLEKEEHTSDKVSKWKIHKTKKEIHSCFIDLEIAFEPLIE